MSIAASEVTRRDDVFRCLPYAEKITGEACLSKQRGALAGTKSLSKCIGCGDGACVAEALNGVAPAADEPDERTPTTPAPPPVEPQETVTMSNEAKRAKQREWQAIYQARKRIAALGLDVPPKGTPLKQLEALLRDGAGSEASAPPPPKPKAAKKPAARKGPKAKIKARLPFEAKPRERPLTEVATLLGIDVDALLGREIARVLGLT